MIYKYAIDLEFKDVMLAFALPKKQEPYCVKDGYLLFGNRLCVTHSMRDKVMYESHASLYVL